jgi:hypothetical protein
MSGPKRNQLYKEWINEERSKIYTCLVLTLYVLCMKRLNIFECESFLETIPGLLYLDPFLQDIVIVCATEMQGVRQVAGRRLAVVALLRQGCPVRSAL